MPSYLQRLKEQNPRLAEFYSDDEIIEYLPTHDPAEFGNLEPEQVRFKALDDRTAIGRGFDAGIDQLQAMGGGAAALVGDVTGIDSVRDWGLDVYRRNMEEAALSAPETNFMDIDGVGDALNWAGYTLGNLAPMMATSVVGGGAGGILAGQGIKATAASMLAGLTSKGVAAGLAKKEVGAFVAKRVALGQALGAASASTGMSAGSIYGETEDAAVSAVHGLVAGSIDALPIMRIFGRFGKSQAAKEALESSVIREIGQQGVLEGGTEAVQTFIEQHANYWVENEGRSLLGNLGDADWSEIIEASAAGALGGGVMGGGASAINREPVFFRRQTPPTPDDELNKAINNANKAATTVLESGGDALSAEIARATTEVAELPAAVLKAQETARKLYTDPLADKTPQEVIDARRNFAASGAPQTISGQTPEFMSAQRPESDQTIPGEWMEPRDPKDVPRSEVSSRPVDINELNTRAQRFGDEVAVRRLDIARRMMSASEQFANEGNSRAATNMSQRSLAIMQDVDAKLQQRADASPSSRVAPQPQASGEQITVWTGRRGDGYATQNAAQAGLATRQKVRPELDWRIEQMPSGKFQLAGYATERAPRDRLTEPDMQAVDTLSQARTEGETQRAGQIDPARREMQGAAIDRAMTSIERRGGVATQAEADLLNEYGMGQPYDRIEQSPVAPPDNVRVMSNGQPFPSEQQARSSIPYRQNPGATVIAQGEGFAVQLPEPLKVKSPESARIERLEQARTEFEDASAQGSLNRATAAVEKADAEIVAFAKESIENGQAPMFVSAKGDLYYTVTPSAQQSGKYQVTVYNDTGMLSDSQLKSLDDVSKEIKGISANPVSATEADQIMARLVEAEAGYRQRRAAFEEDNARRRQEREQREAQEKQTAAAATKADQAEIATINAQAEKDKKAKKRKTINPQTDSIVQAAIKLGGLKPEYRGDILGESRGNKMLPGIGAMFSTNGTSIDEIAARLGDAGYIPPAEMDNLGGVPWLSERLSDELAGRRTTYSLSSLKALEQAQAEQDAVYAGQLEQLEREREAEYAAIEEEYGPEIAAQAREYDEIIENVDSDLSEEADYYENQLAERESIREQGFSDGISAAQAAARDDEIRQGDDQEGRKPAGSGRDAQTASESDRPQLNLSQQTEAERATSEAQAAARQKADDQRKSDAKAKADADAERGDFRLTGSSAPSDVAASYGQGDMLMATRGRAELQTDAIGLTQQEADDIDARIADARRKLRDAEDSAVGLAGLAPGFVEEAMRSRKVPKSAKDAIQNLKQQIRDLEKSKKDITESAASQEAASTSGESKPNQETSARFSRARDSSSVQEVRFGKFKTGQPVTFNYVHNKNSATKLFGLPKKDSPYGRYFEPSGKYMVESDARAVSSDNMEYGEITFQAPLVIANNDLGWKKELSDSYDGKRGKALSKALIADGFDGVVTIEMDVNGNPKYVSEILDLTSFDESKARFSRSQAEKGNLYVGHNLSESNLIHVDEIGGLAAPSLAVARIEFGFDGFGEITLVAGPQILESSKVKTFDADVYSPRHPRAQYTLNSGRYNAFIDSLGETYGLSIPDADSLSSKGAEALLYSDAAKLGFLREQGKEPKTKSRKPSLAVRRISSMPGTKWDKLKSADVQKIAANHYESLIKNSLEVGSDERKDRLKESLRKEYFDGEQVRDHYLRHLVDDAQMLAEHGDVDKADLSRKIASAFKTRKTEQAYEAWAQDKFNEIKTGARIFKGFTNSGNRRYIDYTLDNIVKEMTASLQGGENFNYGAGSVRSVYAQRLSSVKAVQKNRDKIISAEQFDALKSESNDRLAELLEKLKPFYKYDASSWGYMDDASRAIAEGQKGLREAFDLDDDARKDIREFIDFLANMPTSYFEAKAQRAVDLSEFSVAVVPTGTSQKAMDILKSKGLKIVTYKKGDNEARRQAIAKQSKILFSRDAGSRAATIPLDRAQALVSAITSRLNNAPDVIVVQSMQDQQVPEVVRREDAKQRSQGATGEPEGFYYNGKGYIVLDGITTGKDETVARAVARVFAHEVLGHAGLRGLFRGDLDKVLSEVAMKRRGDIRRKAAEYGLDVANREDRLVAAEEVLAELAQTEPENSMVTKAIEVIRRALRRLLMKLPAEARTMLGGSKFIEWVNSMTDAEIIDRFIVPAREFIRDGDGSAAQGVPVFQRGESGDSIAAMANNERGDRSSTMPTPERSTGKSEKLANTKIVNDQGKPLLVKHGSKSTFDEFKAKRGGIYFTTDGADAVAIFTEEGRGDPTEHYLIAERPFDARWKNMSEEGKAELRAIIESVVDSEDIEAAAANLGVDLEEADPFNVFTDGEFFWGYGRNLQDSVMEKIKSSGYDAVIFPDSLSLGEPHVSFVVFKPDQVVPANPNQSPRTDGAGASLFSRSQTDTQEFKRWFGDSKVVDADGKPLVVYHGTDADITEFNTGMSGARTDSGWMGRGFYFGSASTADAYAGFSEMNPDQTPAGANVMPVYLSLQNPAMLVDDIVRADGQRFLVRELLDLPDSATSQEVTDALIAAGYDGAIYQRAPDGGYREYVALRPDQIKSAIGNNGQFDPDNPDIRFSRSNAVNFALPDETLTATVIRKMQDKFKVLKDLQANIKDAGGKIDEGNDAYLAEELFHGKAENDIRKMQEEYVEPLAKKMAQFDISRDQLDEFLYARHARERNARIAEINPDMPDGGSGMTNAEAGAKLAEVRASGKQDQYEQLAGIVYDMLQVQRDMVREGGLESDATIDAWEEGYQFYVPLKGWAEDTKQEGMPRTGKGFAISGKESKRAMGRSSQAASPVSFTINDLTEKLIRRRKNEVGNAFLKLVRANPNPDFWQVYTDEKPETQRAIKKVKDPETGEIVEQVTETAIPMAMLSDRYFTTKKNGKTFYIKINTDVEAGQRLMKAMKNIGPESNGALIRTMAGVTRVMSALNTSYSPEFMISNFARDVQTALLNLQAEQSLPQGSGKAAGVKIAKQTMKDVPKAMKAIYGALRGTEGKTAEQKKWQAMFEQFREDGAKTGWFDMKDLDGQSRSLDNLVAMAQGGFKGKAMLWAREGAQLVENMNQSVENAVRLAAYANAINAGISRKQAASLAKNLTVNFNRRGEVGTVLNAIYMFANASIQGTANFVRTMGTLKGDGKLNWNNLNNAQKIAVGMMGGAYFIGLANRMSAGEDEDDENWYDKVPDYVKERNIVIMKSMFGGEQDGTYWKIPLPYGYNVFYVIGNAIEAVAGGGKSVSESAADVTLAALGSFSPIGFQDSESGANMILKNMAPTIIKPIVEVALNENFMGSSIYTENLPFGTPRPDSALGRNSTPEAYRALTKWLNEVSGGTEYRPGAVDINPDVMQHFLDYFGGSAYAFFGSKVPDAVHRAAAGVVAEENRVPFLSRISGRVMPYADTEKFYQRRDAINQLYDEYRAIPAGERTGFDGAEYIRMRPLLRATERRLSALRKRRNEIYTADMSLRERDPLLKEIESEMKEVIDRFNKAYNAIDQ